jgi:hypothetical protein
LLDESKISIRDPLSFLVGGEQHAVAMRDGWHCGVEIVKVA